MKGQQVEEPTQSARRVRDERLLIRLWRREQFVDLGFPLSDAAALAKSSADLGEARRLIAAGCECRLAFRIIR
jgi:hypothetical protein